MTARALVAPGTLRQGARLTLDDAEARHLRVRRLAPGDPVELLDGVGASASATLEFIGARCDATVGEVRLAPRPSVTVLAVGAGDKDRFLLLAEHATELAVTRIIPLATGRARDVATRLRGEGIARARRRAREACKQCGNPWATDVDEECDLGAIAARAPSLRWLLADRDGPTCPAIGAHAGVGWIIGPEGGLTPAELEVCARLGAQSVRFSPAVLRFDTAAIAAAVITLDRRGAG